MILCVCCKCACCSVRCSVIMLRPATHCNTRYNTYNIYTWCHIFIHSTYRIHTQKSWHMYKWVMSYIWTTSCCIRKELISHVHISHVTRTLKCHLTYTKIMLHMLVSHVTRIITSCRVCNVVRMSHVSVLQCVAVYCSVLQCVAVCWSVMQSVAVGSSGLQ